MTWKIAQAKQNLSQVIRAAATEPQQIFNRNRLVAAVISGETLAHFEAWRRERQLCMPLAEAFAELRALCTEDDYEFPESSRRDRPNPFVNDLGK
jgi:prevent-host-death family protein